MRGTRRVWTTGGILSLALVLLAAAVVSPEPLSHRMPMAIAQPLARSGAPLAATRPPFVLPDSGLLALVGTALIGLGTLVRRTTT
jgi:hypothetical protein